MRRFIPVLVLAAGCVSRDGETRPAPPPVTLTAAKLPAPIREAPEPSLVRVLVAGDVAPNRPTLGDPARVTEALAPLAPLFGAADAAIVAYDTTTGDPSRLAPRRAGVVAEPTWMGALRDAHVTALSVAGGHACDLGAAGLDATLHTASRLGLHAIGADPTARWSARTIAEKHGRRVCALEWTERVAKDSVGACDGSLAIVGPRHDGAERVEEGLTRARAAGCDAVIAIVHAGEEDASLPRRLARHAADAGADAVVVDYAHAPGDALALASRDGRRVPAFLSMGNLVAPRPGANAWSKMGVVADLVFTFQDAGERPNVSWGYQLVTTDADRARAKTPRITAHLFDPDGDPQATARLERAGQAREAQLLDRGGPAQLLASPCLLSRHPAHCN